MNENRGIGKMVVEGRSLSRIDQEKEGSWKGVERLLSGLIAAAFALKFWLISRLNINWDEFYFLSLVHEYIRGTLTIRLQTFHVHLFSWLPSISSHEITQIIIGRLVMAMLAVGSAFCLYKVGRQFLSRSGALFGIFSYLSFSSVIVHGTSFRTDPLATFLMCLSLYAVCLHLQSLFWIVGAGIALALATLVTIKTVIHLMMIAMVFLCLLLMGTDRRGVSRAVGIFFVTYGVALAALYFCHDSTLATKSSVDPNVGLHSIAKKVLVSGGLFPRRLYVARNFQLNPIIWLLVFVGLLSAAVEASRSVNIRDCGKHLFPAVLALPLVAIFFYRNVFPYYFVFMFAPGILLAGLAYEQLSSATQRGEKKRKTVFPLVLILLVIGGFLIHSYRNSYDRTLLQRQTISVVHARFPQPVPYIDGFGMLASFPRVGFFMRTWGMDNYLAVGRPIYADLVATSAPLFLLANSPALFSAMFPQALPYEGQELLPDDVQFLRENYLRYWGILHVVGKRITLAHEGQATIFEIIVPGVYRLATEREITIDGQMIEPGASIHLARGKHEAKSEQESEVILHWAAVGPPPPGDPGATIMFRSLRKQG